MIPSNNVYCLFDRFFPNDNAIGMWFLVTGECERPLPGQTKSSINSSDGKFTGIDCDRTKTGEFTKDDKYELNF